MKFVGIWLKSFVNYHIPDLYHSVAACVYIVLLNTLMERLNASGKIAFITGASGGIGKEFARQLADRGYNLVLVAHQLEGLNQLAEEIEGHYPVHATTLVADFTKTTDVINVVAYIKNAERVDVLVNCAGYSEHTPFYEQDEISVLNMLNVQVMATVRLVHAALPKMIARRGGGIVTVSSLAAFTPAPGASMYSASKAFLNTFMETLHMEVHNYDIKVQSLCPGPTHTGFHHGQDVEESVAGIDFWMEPEDVVAISLKALERGEVVCVPGIINKVIKNVAPMLPRRPYYHLAEKMAAKFRNEPGSDMPPDVPA